MLPPFTCSQIVDKHTEIHPEFPALWRAGSEYQLIETGLCSPSLHLQQEQMFDSHNYYLPRFPF